MVESELFKATQGQLKRQEMKLFGGVGRRGNQLLLWLGLGLELVY